MPIMNRRVFVKQGALSLLALGLPPQFLTRSLLAETRGAARRKTLICIFQRGAVDGLNMVVPFGEGAYYQARRSIAVPQPKRGDKETALDLDGFFGLHPSLRPLRELYDERELAVLHAVGSPNPTRSHFEAQDYLETAVPGDASVRDGWLNRVLSDTGCSGCRSRTLADPAAHAADHASGQAGVGSVEALRGVAMGSGLPIALRGEHPATAVSQLERFGVAGGDDSLAEAFERLYRLESGDEIAAAADGAFDAMQVLEHADPLQYEPANGVEYPRNAFGRSLRQIAQLIKADVGVEIAFADVGGWDTHRAQGGSEGALAVRLERLAQGIRALHDDLGDRMADAVILTMSEFGRTVAENGSRGTDHGHANCMLVLGGAVRGGRVIRDWPGLEVEQRYEGRDLAVTTDFRDVFAEIASGHLGATDLERVFPGHAIDSARFPGVLR